ncbi:MAG: hypothetical protein IKU25_08745 [Clostridia bacterium]|nr:hypothetical protein [Clostridia bacterium]
MIIHSIVSLDDIFFTPNDCATKLVPIKYGFVEVESGENSAVRRLISTNPSDYLNVEYQPCCKFKI